MWYTIYGCETSHVMWYMIHVTECDCDPDGSQYNGQCDSHTDTEYGLEAGRCTCKTHVSGPRCDVCEDGYWNMNASNPDGCQGQFKLIYVKVKYDQGYFGWVRGKCTVHCSDMSFEDINT